jgi:hypothetical protein
MNSQAAPIIEPTIIEQVSNQASQFIGAINSKTSISSPLQLSGINILNKTSLNDLIRPLSIETLPGNLMDKMNSAMTYQPKLKTCINKCNLNLKKA